MNSNRGNNAQHKISMPLEIALGVLLYPRLDNEKGEWIQER